MFVGKSVSAQNNLEINIKDCRQESSFEYLSEFKVFRDDTLIETVEPKDENKQILKDLKYGEFRIEFN